MVEVMYEGDFMPTFVKSVREGKYGVSEGVICKGLDGPAWHLDAEGEDAPLPRRVEAAVRGRLAELLGVTFGCVNPFDRYRRCPARERKGQYQLTLTSAQRHNRRTP